MHIVVTGASKGIGYELVRLFALKGHRVIVIARSRDKLAQLEGEFKHGSKISLVEAIPYDLAQGDIEKDLPARIGQKVTKIDILINNAGLLINKPVQTLTSDNFDALFRINVRSAFLLVKALLPMMNNPAHVVNIGSMGGYQGSAKFPGLSLYSASKGALAVLTECLAEELKESGVKVNCLALGAAQTEMLSHAFPGYQAPLSAKEMASYIFDFACHGHMYFNGKILPVSVSTP